MNKLKTISFDYNKSSFSQFKDDFYERFEDLSVFNCNTINLLKVVLDGLKVNYLSKGKFNPYWFNSTHRLKRFINRFSSSKVFHLPKVDVLLVDPGRWIEDAVGKKKSVFFSRFNEQLEGKKISKYTIQLSGTKIDSSDIHFEDLIEMEKRSLNPTQKKHRKDLNSFLENLGKKLNRYDCNNVRCAIHKYFREYIIWSAILDECNPKLIWFICHYHNEGLIHAAKERNIKICELQHGLISKADIFYLFPRQVESIRDYALFPDEIWTFGKYWADLLNEFGNEFSKDKIKVGGYYLMGQDNSTDSDLIALKQQFDKIFVVATQTKLFSIFIQYIQSVYSELEKINGLMLIKLHPNDAENNYGILRSLPNIKIIRDKTLSQLLPISDYHITIYSTTIFDAIRLGFHQNFCLEVCSHIEYVNQIIALGIADVLSIGKLPDKYRHSNIHSDWFYAPMNLPLG